MYPHVTQFETRDRRILDELRVREERLLARPLHSLTRRATALPTRLVRMLRVTQAGLRG